MHTYVHTCKHTYIIYLLTYILTYITTHLTTYLMTYTHTITYTPHIYIHTCIFPHKNINNLFTYTHNCRTGASVSARCRKHVGLNVIFDNLFHVYFPTSVLKRQFALPFFVFFWGCLQVDLIFLMKGFDVFVAKTFKNLFVSGAAAKRHRFRGT